MGPLLFLLHINDLPSVVDPGTSVRLFADDTLIYRVIHSMEDQVALQRDLARLEQWAESWGMVFNASKCHIMHVSRSSSSHQYLYQFRGVVLSSVTSEKYLGVYLNHDLKWSHHIDQVTAKAARKLGFVRYNLRGSPDDCKKLAYISLVRSGMEYASIIWDPYTKADSNKLEKIQRSAARWIYSVWRDVTLHYIIKAKLTNINSCTCIVRALHVSLPHSHLVDYCSNCSSSSSNPSQLSQPIAAYATCCLPTARTPPYELIPLIKSILT